jgi:hypothetical protein
LPLRHGQACPDHLRFDGGGRMPRTRPTMTGSETTLHPAAIPSCFVRTEARQPEASTVTMTVISSGYFDEPAPPPMPPPPVCEWAVGGKEVVLLL